MAEEIQQSEEVQQDEIKPLILENIQSILGQMKIAKVYFIDDAINQDTGRDTFKGIVQAAIAADKIDELKTIPIQGIDFNTDTAVLPNHIDAVWDTLKHAKQLRYFERVYTIIGNPQAINDLNVSNNLKDFFAEGQIEFLTPPEWEAKEDEILQAVPEGEKILLLFDQDLKLSGGKYAEGVQGENLILALKQKGVPDKVVVSLLTHTTPLVNQELPERSAICDRVAGLSPSEFFVLAKVRLEKPAMFADGLKKVCLNTYCEQIKDSTIDILTQAQEATIDKLKKIDTYDFDHTIFKSSNTEGVWEPETLLRITDVIFRDEVRKLMVEKNYVESTNPSICAAADISKIEFKIEDLVDPYKERFKLRHQEIYEAGNLLNSLRKPIENGDIFIVTEGEKKDKKFILVAQECDMMVRGATGERGARTAVLLEIEPITEKQLHKEMSDKYKKESDRGKFNNHFFADRYKLEYFEEGTSKIGLVHFTRATVIDLNVTDLIVFNPAGEATIDLATSTYDEKYHNNAWKNRYKLIHDEFTAQQAIIDQQFNAIAAVGDIAIKEAMQAKLSYLFSFINKTGIQISYTANKFSFGLKRVARLRNPKSKNLLDRYTLHLSRFAELHDFAE